MNASQPVNLHLVDQSKETNMLRILDSLGIKAIRASVREEERFDFYDVQLQQGIRYSKLDRALSEIGMLLCAHSVPKGYPVMAEGVYRIEVQLKELGSVPYMELHESQIHDLKSGLRYGGSMFSPIILGLDSFGTPLVIDLAALPNLLIGGIPGSGKSVLLHSIILSLLDSSAEVYLIDPKMVEFDIYLNHPQVRAIKNTVDETLEIIQEIESLMESRFRRLQKYGCRDIFEYNRKSRTRDRLRPVIMVIDEWADLVLQDSKIQKPLCSVAQKGRAAGISIVIATQRPSANVISGLIKANFSGRIGLKVAAAVDSRIILEQSGAEKITDIGVGLFLDQRMSEPTMFRAPFIKSPAEELSKLYVKPPKVSFWKRFGF